MPRDESKGGFTLVELMIVVAIIGVLAAIAIPNWLDMNYRAKRAEMPIIVNAVQHAEFGFDGLYDGFVMADPHPGGVPSKGYQNWGAGNTGFNHLLTHCDTADVIVTLEGDNTSDPGILKEMIDGIRQGADVVLASCHHHRGGIANVTWWRVILSHVANGLAKYAFNLNAIATLSSFYRAYRVSSLQAVRAAYGEPLLRSGGFECMVELLAKLNYCDQLIEEVPMVLDSSRRSGKSKMRIVSTIGGYLRLLVRKLFTQTLDQPKS